MSVVKMMLWALATLYFALRSEMNRSPRESFQRGVEIVDRAADHIGGRR